MWPCIAGRSFGTWQHNRSISGGRKTWRTVTTSSAKKINQFVQDSTDNRREPTAVNFSWLFVWPFFNADKRAQQAESISVFGAFALLRGLEFAVELGEGSSQITSLQPSVSMDLSSPKMRKIVFEVRT